MKKDAANFIVTFMGVGMRILYVLVALVVATSYAFAGVYTDSGDGTMTDPVTNLMWQKQDDGTVKSWESAIAYCEGLSLGEHTDWRLPNNKELSSLVDESRYLPAINTTYFPSTLSSSYWSSTTNALNTALAWYVDFYNGSTSSSNKTGTGYVRCVR